MTEREWAAVAQEGFDLVGAMCEHLNRTNLAQATVNGLVNRLAKGENVSALFHLAFDRLQREAKDARNWSQEAQPPYDLPPDVFAAVTEGLRQMTIHWDSLSRYYELSREVFMARMRGRSGAAMIRKGRRSQEHYVNAQAALQASAPLMNQATLYPVAMLQQAPADEAQMTTQACAM